jgi:hypothetical protein
MERGSRDSHARCVSRFRTYTPTPACDDIPVPGSEGDALEQRWRVDQSSDLSRRPSGAILRAGRRASVAATRSACGYRGRSCPYPDIINQSLTFSRDSKFIYYLGRNTGVTASILRRVAVAGGSSDLILTNVEIATRVSADGSELQSSVKNRTGPVQRCGLYPPIVGPNAKSHPGGSPTISTTRTGLLTER